MSDSTVCGLPLIGMPDTTPLAALVIVKVFDADGGNAYHCKATGGLSTVEALGMVAYADVRLRDYLVNPDGHDW